MVGQQPSVLLQAKQSSPPPSPRACNGQQTPDPKLNVLITQGKSSELGKFVCVCVSVCTLSFGFVQMRVCVCVSQSMYVAGSSENICSLCCMLHA